MTMAREKEILLSQFSSLIYAMDSTEIEIAKKHIIAYDSTTTGESHKMFQIFSEIVKVKNISYEELKNKVSPKVNNLSFNRQLRRTLYRIQESLIIDVNLKRKGLYEGLFRKKYEIRKRIMQASILYSRGLPDMADRVYNNIIKVAKAYELYDEIIEAMMFKQPITLYKKGKKSYDALNETIDFYKNCRTILQTTKEIYQSYTAELFGAGRKNEKIEYLAKNLKLTNEFYYKTNSVNIKSYNLLLKMEFCYITDDFDGEESAGLELLNLMSNSKAVYSKGRIVYVCNSLANSKIANLDFEASYNYIQKGIKNTVVKENINYIIAAQQQITLLFYLGDHIRAAELLNALLEIKMLNKYSFHKSTTAYQVAINEFALSNFKHAYEMLSNLKEIEKDKEGWNVWAKIMRILCSIEMLKLNLIDYDVENFRKYIQRIEKSYSVRKRDKIIVRVLRDLDKYDYDFQVVADKSASLIEQLRTTEDELKWDPKSPEMILFHDWFDAKLNKRPYKPNFDPYRSKLKEKKLEVE